MPTTRITSFGSRSFMAASITTDTNAPTGVALAFLPTVDRVRKARLAFDISAADGFSIEIEFSDAAFEELSLTGEPREARVEERSR